MSWRKWFVRGLVFSIAGACACAVFVFRHWTSPAVVRQQVVARLEAYFPGAHVALDSARLRILGGIVLSELYLARRDDPNKVSFIHVPSAIIHIDKEKLLDGSVGIPKVELDRPRLRLVRHRDGHWNLDGITGPMDPSKPLPTMVIHQGTLILDDRLGALNLPSLEITNISMTLINDPLPSVTIDGRAHSDYIGDLEIHGAWNRESREMALSLQVQGVPLTPALMERLAGNCPAGTLDGIKLEGTADLKADLVYFPGSTQPLGYDVRCHLTRGKLKHPRVPLVLENLDARLRCTNGQVHLENLQAVSGPSRVKVQGMARLPCPEKHFEGIVEIQHLQLCAGLFEQLPKEFQNLYRAFTPKGPATLRMACARRGGQWAALVGGAPSTFSLVPEDIQAAFHHFPYPLEHITGSIDMNLLSNRILVDVVGHSGARPVSIKGTWEGKVPLQADARFEIQANDLPLDEKLLAALGKTPPHEKLARSFHAKGLGDIRALIRHVPGRQKFLNEYHVRFHDAEVQWDPFPYHLTEVSGFLDIYPEHWEFYDFKGRHKDSPITVQGRTLAGNDRAMDRLVVDVAGKNVALEADLKKALEAHPILGRAWDTCCPSGRLDFAASIDRPLTGSGEPAAEARVLRDLDVRVAARGCTIEPKFFPYALHGLAGRFHYHKGKMKMTQVSARHDGTEMGLKSGTIDLQPAGGFYADLKNLQARDLRLNEDFLKAIKVPALKQSCAALELKDPVLVQTDLIVAQAAEGEQPDIYWDGQLWLKKAGLRTGLEMKEVTGALASRGRSWRDNSRGQLLALNGNFRLDHANLLNQPFHDVVGHFQVREHAPEVLNLGLRAPLFGGDVSGQVRLNMNSQMGYEINLTASQIDLEEFGRHNLGPDSQLKGAVLGRLFLTGQGANAETLDGNGRLDIPRGQLKTLPLLLDLLKFLGLRWPDRTLFEEAHALFRINGRRVSLQSLELLGNAISLYGKGDFKLDGSDVKIDFYPSWGRIEMALGSVLRTIPAELGKTMLKIEVRGQVSSNPNDLKFTKKPLPILVDPLLYMRDKVAGKK